MFYTKVCTHYLMAELTFCTTVAMSTVAYKRPGTKIDIRVIFLEEKLFPYNFVKYVCHFVRGRYCVFCVIFNN